MKKLFLLPALFLGITLFAQNYAKDWHLNYSPKDTVYGIDLINAMKEVPRPATAKPVIVAVIDNGVDVIHPDIKANLWINSKEIPGNAVDDDHNGYIDDINGWDFLGSLSKDINYDNLEMTRQLRDYKTKFGTKTSKEIAKSDKAEYKKYKALEEKFNKEYEKANSAFKIYQNIHKYLTALSNELDSQNVTVKQLEGFSPNTPDAKLGYAYMMSFCQKTGMTPKEIFDQFKGAYDYFNAQVNYHYNLDYDPRKVIGDDYNNVADNKYGNNEVKGPEGEHGTHVAGIIGAVRDNNVGIQGINPLVQIMVLRVVPDGDERDKDVALAIRYAADNGAKVINMSFGKAYSHNKAAVDAAIKYAESKDVLIVHAAGNDNKNTDKESNFPTPRYLDGTNCSTWIEVGASDKDMNPADFSNYGKTTVNVFAPGVNIYSTIPDNKYKAESGTSMAAPVVAGIAGLIRAYYPNLTAVQVKQAIESTVIKPESKVKLPGTKKKKTKYKKLCTTAGFVSASAALKAASLMK